jgi:hypothetical protein
MTAMMQLVIVTRSLLAWAATANAVRSWLDSWPGIGPTSPWACTVRASTSS